MWSYALPQDIHVARQLKYCGLIIFETTVLSYVVALCCVVLLSL